MEIRLPESLPIKEGFYRYKCCVREEETNEIVAYLEGNKKFHRDFQGETFYKVGKMVYTYFTNHKGKTETLKLSEIDTTDLDLILLDKSLKVLHVYPRTKDAKHQRKVSKARKEKKK